MSFSLSLSLSLAKWERRMLPARKFDFDTAVGAIGSNERKWNCDDVVLMFERPSEADSDAVDAFLEFFEPPFGKLIHCVHSDGNNDDNDADDISLFYNALNSLNLSYFLYINPYLISHLPIVDFLSSPPPSPPPLMDVPTIHDKLSRQSVEATAIKAKIFSYCYNCLFSDEYTFGFTE